MKIKAIFVDLGGVIVVNGAREIGEKFEKSDGLTREMTSKIFRYIQTANRSNEEINKYLDNENVDQETWNKYTKELYSSEMRNDVLVNLLFQAKAKGIRIVFTTNNSSAVAKGIQKYKIEDLADLVINSSELQVAKPDKEFWEAAIKETQRSIPDITREEILVIDDSKTNCLSAEEFGFHCFLYKNDSETNKKLKTLVEKI